MAVRVYPPGGAVSLRQACFPVFPITYNSNSNNINNAVMIIIYWFTHVPDTVPTISLLPAFRWKKKKRRRCKAREWLCRKVEPVCSVPTLMFFYNYNKLLPSKANEKRTPLYMSEMTKKAEGNPERFLNSLVSECKVDSLLLSCIVRSLVIWTSQQALFFFP